MPDYNKQIYDWIVETDPTFKDKKSFQEFASDINADDNYVNEIYQYVSGIDLDFEKALSPEKFAEQMRSSIVTLEDKRTEEAKEKVDVEVKSTYQIDKELPEGSTKEEIELAIDQRYGPYLELLQQPNQNVAFKTVDGQNVPLEGDELQDFIVKIQEEKQGLKDKLTYEWGNYSGATTLYDFATQITDWDQNNIATEEEIVNDMVTFDSDLGVPYALYRHMKNDGMFFIENNYDLTEEELEAVKKMSTWERKQFLKDKPINPKIAEQQRKEILKARQEIRADQLNILDKYQDKPMQGPEIEAAFGSPILDLEALPGPGDIGYDPNMANLQYRINRSLQTDIENITEGDIEARMNEASNDLDAIYNETDLQKSHALLKNSAEELGYVVTSDLSLKGKTDKNGNEYFYLPKASYGTEDNPGMGWNKMAYDNPFRGVSDMGEGKKSVYYNASFGAVQNAKYQNSFNDPKNQKKLNNILEEFEGELGVGNWNNFINVLGTATGTKAIIEATTDKTLDAFFGVESSSREGYLKSREQLAEILQVNKNTADYQAAVYIADVKKESVDLMTMEADLRNTLVKLQNNPNRTEADVQNFYNKRDALILKQKQIKSNLQYLSDVQFTGNFEQIKDRTMKSYDELQVMENIMWSSGARFVAGISSLLNEVNLVNVAEWAGYDLKDSKTRDKIVQYAEDVFGETGGDIVEFITDVSVATDEYADDSIANMYATSESYLAENRPPVEFDQIDNVFDFLSWGGEMMSSQVWNTAASVLIPGMGGVILSAGSAAGEEMHSLKKRIEGEEWSEEEKQYIQDYKKEFGYNPLGDDDQFKIKPEDINALQFYGTAALVGGGEYISEAISLGTLKLGAKNIRNAFDLSKGVRRGVSDIPISNEVAGLRYTNLKKSLKDYAKGTVEESFGEGVAQLSNNFAHIYILDDDISILDGMTESMVAGAFMNNTFQSPAVIANASKAFMGPSNIEKNAARGNQIVELSNSIKKKKSQLSMLTPSDASHASISKSMQVEEDLLHELAKEQLQEVSNIRSNVASLTKNDRQSLIDLFNKEHSIRSKIDSINKDENLNENAKKEKINQLKTELVQAEAIKKVTLGNAEWNADKQRAAKFANAYRAKNGTLDRVEMIAADNNSQALEAGLEYIETLKDLSPEEKNQVKEQLKEQFNAADKASIGPKGEKVTVNGFAWGDGVVVETTNPDGTKSERTVQVPMTFALNRNNPTVMSHEVGHHTLFKQFMEGNPDAIGLVADLEAYVNKNYGEAYKAFNEVQEIYGKYDSTGELSNKAEVAEEKLARLSEFMRQNNLQGMRRLRNKLFGRFQKFNDGSGQIKDGKDVFDMLVSYNESFETGKLTGLTKSVAEGTAEISRKKKSVEAMTKPKSRKMNSKFSMTAAEKAEIADTMNEMPGPRDAQGNYIMTKEEWQADKDRALSKAITMAMDGDLDGLIVEKMERGETIHDLSREEFMRRVYQKLGMHIYNFDPSVNDKLFGWVNGYLGKRVGDVANQAKREKQKAPPATTSTDQTIGEEGRTVAETIKGDDAASIEAAVDASLIAESKAEVIDNLRTRLNIEKGGDLYNKVVTAVEKTFGRTKLKDVSNKEFKQDLKNKFNTELFKDVKNELGTRKKYQEFIEGKVSFKNADGQVKTMPRWKMLFDYFSQGVVNKRFEQFKEPLIDPATGKQARPDNNPLFRKRNDLTKEEWVNYFLGKDVGASTKGTRKDALASAIAEELAFDATMEVLEDPSIQNKIKEFYELQGLRQAENFTEKVGKTIDRTPGAKFSMTTVQDKSLNQELQDYWTTKNVRDKINEGKSLISIFNEFYNKLNNRDRQALNNVKNEIEAISTARSVEADALADFDWDAQMLETTEGNIPFNLDIVDTASFNNWLNNLISEGVIPNPVIKVNGKEVNLFQQPTLPGKGARRKDGTKKITAFSQQQYQNFKDGLQELGKFLPENLKNSGLIKTALSQASTLYVEGKDGVITSAEITGDLKTNKSTNKTEVKNPKVQPPKWGDTRSTKGKITKGINSLIKDVLNDPNFDPSNPIDTKKISDIINEKASPEQIAEIQELGIELAKALNNMVNSQKPFTEGWWKAFNFANQILTQQTNANTGVFRMMHGVEAVSTTVGKNRPFRMEHNVQNSRFMQNVKAQIVQDGINKLKNKDSKFDSNINKIYNLAKRNMMLLDKDVQVVADAGVGSPTFNKGIKVLEQKFGKGWLTPERLEMIKKVAGTTALQEGFDPNHATVINNILPFGLADKTIHVPSGLTYDQLMLNQMQGKLAVDYISSITDGIKKQIESATLGEDVLQDNNTSKVLKENADARQRFSMMLSEASEKNNNPDAKNKLNENSIETALNVKFSKSYNSKNEANSKLMNNSTVTTKFSKSKNTTEDVIREAEILDKALNVARDPEAPVKKIRVFDFDDTLARTKSNVLYTMPDGTKGKLTAEEFAQRGDEMVAEGAVWDFSEFNKVMEGKKGPLFEVAQKIQEARGTKDVFVLTARAQAAAPAIKEFLDSVGLNIPLENITGLGDSSPLAKSNWMVDKAAEGYNDFYFADDHLGNVDAVDRAMSVIDIKSKTQQAKINFSKTIDETVNDMLEHKFGIKSEKEYSAVKAKLRGRKKGKFKFFVPPTAEDFIGLLYSMLGKGEIGDMQMEFFKEHLIEPYGRAMEDLSRDQNRMINDFKVLKEQLVKEGLIPKNLNKKTSIGFTYQDISRVLAWHKQGFEIPGLSKTDLNEIIKFGEQNPATSVFADNLIKINKGDGYTKPNQDWLAGTISTDLLDGLRTGKRSKYLQQWQDNVDIIFSPKNLNKMEAAMGPKWRESMEHILSRMKSGRNRVRSGTRLENRVLDYINNSVGTVMFFNMRSAILQTISSINFINWTDNNILKAGAAFANQPQYWKDFMELMNSDFLVERRNGLKLNVSESEIADAAATSKNKAKAAVSYILQKGYLPTQFADSFAIASGGATFYRNKIKSLMKQGMSETDAKAQAFLEFREIAEESQQSSRPDRISQQQASGLGRLILAFANTPMQYNRIIKKSFLDLKNRRGDWKTNVSKIAYYGAIQNVIFNALQQAVFALAFDDEEEEDKKQKYYNTANGMLDSILRGAGIAGVGASTLLAVVQKVYKEAKKEGTFPGPDYADAAFELLNFAPPIDIKVNKMKIAGNTWKYEGWKHDEAKWGIDDPAWKSAAYVISSLTNVPVDRLFKKFDNVQGALDSEEETWKRVAQALGWTKWQLEKGSDLRAEREAEKPRKKQSIKNMYGPSNPQLYSKDEQISILKQYGYSEDEIKAMKKQENRVQAILDKQKETGKTIKPKAEKAYKFKPLINKKEFIKQEEEEDLKEQTNKYKKLKKPRQVEILDSLGLSKKDIRALQYEKDRVAKIIELMNQ